MTEICFCDFFEWFCYYEKMWNAEIFVPNDFPAGNTVASTGATLPSARLPSPVPRTYPICSINLLPMPRVCCSQRPRGSPESRVKRDLCTNVSSGVSNASRSESLSSDESDISKSASSTVRNYLFEHGEFQFCFLLFFLCRRHSPRGHRFWTATSTMLPLDSNLIRYSSPSFSGIFRITHRCHKLFFCLASTLLPILRLENMGSLYSWRFERGTISPWE